MRAEGVRRYSDGCLPDDLRTWGRVRWLDGVGLDGSSGRRQEMRTEIAGNAEAWRRLTGRNVLAQEPTVTQGDAPGTVHPDHVLVELANFNGRAGFVQLVWEWSDLILNTDLISDL